MGDGSKAVFKCPDCDNVYARNSFVERHRRLKHLDIRPFECDGCPSKFSRSDLLSRHKKICRGKRDQDQAVPSKSSTDPALKGKKRGGGQKKNASASQNEPEASSSTLKNVIAAKEAEQTSITPSDCARFGRVVEGVINLPPTSTSADAEVAPFATASYLLPYSLSLNSLLTESLRSIGDPSAGGGENDGSTLTAAEIQDASATIALNSTSSLIEMTHSLPLGVPAFNFDDLEIYQADLESQLRQQQTQRQRKSTPTQLESPVKGTVTEVETDFNLQSVGWGSGLNQWDISNLLFPLTSSSSIPSITPSTPTSATQGRPLEQSNSIPPEPGVFSLTPEEISVVLDNPESDPSAENEGFICYRSPAIVPRKVFQQDEYGQSGQFYIPSATFSGVYSIPGFKVPPRKTLARYASKAFAYFCTTFPVLHTASTRLWECNPQLSFSLCTIGAYYEDVGDESCFVAKIAEKRPYIMRDFGNTQTTEDGKFGDLQALLIYHLLGLALRDSTEQIALALSLHGCTVMMANSMRLIESVKNAKFQELQEWESTLQSGSKPDPYQLDFMWRRWVKRETVKRVTFLVWLVDLECSARLSFSYPLTKISELDIDIPYSDHLWNAPDSRTWYLKFVKLQKKPVSFLFALCLLLADHTESENQHYGFGTTIWDLPDMTGFAETVLLKTLWFIKRLVVKCQTTSQHIPKSFAEIGLKGNDFASMLKRIDRAISTLKKWATIDEFEEEEWWLQRARPVWKNGTSAAPAERLITRDDTLFPQECIFGE